MPDSMRSCGELNTPPQRMTSRFGFRFADLPTLAVTNTTRSLLLEQQFADGCSGLNGQIGPLPGRVEIGNRRAASAAVSNRKLTVAEALLGGAVIIVHGRMACGLATGNEGVEQWIREVRRRYPERTVAAAKFVRACRPCLLPFEIGQDVSVGPFRQATACPAIIIGPVAPNICHRVDRGGTADDLASIHRKTASREG